MGECSSRCEFDTCHWKLFRDGNFDGDYNDMCQNDGQEVYTGQSSWANWQFKNDDVSSVSLSADNNGYCQYEMCQHSDGSGWCVNAVAQEGRCCAYTLSELEDHGFVV